MGSFSHTHRHTQESVTSLEMGGPWYARVQTKKWSKQPVSVWLQFRIRSVSMHSTRSGQVHLQMLHWFLVHSAMLGVLLMWEMLQRITLWMSAFRGELPQRVTHAACWVLTSGHRVLSTELGRFRSVFPHKKTSWHPLAWFPPKEISETTHSVPVNSHTLHVRLRR